MRCATCDAEIDPKTLGGLCPICLFDAAIPDKTHDSSEAFRYDLIEEIARGGMGVVYRAVQHGSQRQVAVKMILAEQAATPGMIERFRAEAEAVAALDHPNILPIYETGEIDGIPFYSMKLAEGRTLREAIADFRGEPRAAATLIAAIARAVHHAHQRGILHRDLKPGNILLDGEGRTPFVSDFGLAKWIGSENRLTIAPSALGTPHYMAPEQALGASAELTTAADVYSLGAILYELLTGQPPFTAETALETLRLVETAAPAPPRLFEPSIPRDLEVICLKCLAKEPSARYASAAALAEDLERWLEGRTILARPATKAERLSRWARRNPAVAALAAAVIVLLLAATIGSGIAALRIAAARDQAVAAEKDATEKLYGSYLDQARASRLAGKRFDALDALDKAARIHRSSAVRDQTIAALALVDFKPGAKWMRPVSLYRNAAFDQKLERYLVEEKTGELSVRNVATHQEVTRLAGPPSPLGLVHAFSNDGRYVAAKFLNEQTWVWDLSSGHVLLRVPGQVGWTNGHAAFSPNSRLVAVTHPQTGISLYRLDEIPPGGELDPERPWRRWDDAPFCHRLVFSPTGTHLAMVDVADAARVGGREGIFQVRTIEDGAIAFEHRSAVGYGTLDWSPDGKLLAVCSWDHHVYVHDAASGAVRQVLRGHLGTPIEVRFSHNGRWLATIGFDNSLRLWDVQSGALLAAAPTSDLALQFSADDQRLAVSFQDGTIGWLEIAPADIFRMLHPPVNGDRPWALAASPDGGKLASSGDAGIRIWDLESMTSVGLPPGAAGERVSICFAPDNSALLASYRGSGLHRWPLHRVDGNLELGAPEPVETPSDTQCLLTDISRDGRQLALSYLDKDFVSLVPAHPDGLPRLDLAGHPNAFYVVISPDGRWVASGTRTNGGVRVWNAASGEVACDLEANVEARPAFSSDSKWLLTGSAGGYQFWKSGTWEKGPRIEPENGGSLTSFSSAFSPKGNLLAVQQNGDRIALHDVRNATRLATLEAPHPSMTEFLQFTGDGLHLAALGANQVVQLWDIPALRRELRRRELDWNDQ